MKDYIRKGSIFVSLIGAYLEHVQSICCIIEASVEMAEKQVGYRLGEDGRI